MRYGVVSYPDTRDSQQSAMMHTKTWTDIEILDCEVAGFRVATALAMTGVVNLDPGPECTDVYSTLNHCTGALHCGLTLPATAADIVLTDCTVVRLMRERLGDAGKAMLSVVGS